MVSTVLIIGCTETLTELPTDPDELYLSPTSAVVGALSAPAAASNYFVVFDEEIPDGFEAMAEAVGASIEAAYPVVGVAVVSGLEGTGAAAGLSAVSGAAFVELEPLVEEPLSMSEPLSNDVSGHTVGDPEDAHWRSFQWNLEAIGASEAWAAGRLGESSATVAILNTGVDYLHNDLVGQVDRLRHAD